MQKVLWGIAIFWLSGATVWGQALSKAEACRLCLAQNLELRTQQAEVEVAHQRGATSYLQLLTFQQRLVGLRRESVDLSLQATKSLHALQAASNWSPGR